MTEKPKICVIAATPLTVHFFFTEHLRQMSKWADVTVVFNDQLDTHITISEQNMRVKHVPIIRKVSVIGDIWALILLMLHIRNERYDMVVTLVPKAGFLGMMAANLFKTRVRLHIFQGEVWVARFGVARFVFKLADIITAKLATNILAVSHSERDFLYSHKITSGKHIDVLGEGSICGVDAKKFSPNKKIAKKQRNAMRIPDGAVVALFLGRICRDKGVFELVNVFCKLAREIPDLWLVIAGPDEENLKSKLINSVDVDLRTRLIFTGYFQRPVELINASDFLCLLSHREGFGLSVVEAAACGVPSLGTKIHGLSDAIIDAETGILVSVENQAEILTGMRQLSTNARLRSRLGAKARARAISLYEKEQVVSAYDRYFHFLLHSQ